MGRRQLRRCALHLVKQLKTRSSLRQVVLVSVAVDALGRHVASARSNSCSASNADDHGLVFLDTVSKPCTPPTSCNGASIRCWHGPGSRGFASRTYTTVPATLLLGLGIHPKIVIEMLGHSQIAITLDLYSHVTATMQQEAARAFEGLPGSQVGSQKGATEH
jgi:integrase